jgi:tetratricopeptide (TPR) repeat protein
LAYIYRQNNKNSQALNCFERLIRLDPQNEDYLYEAANTYILLQKPLDAVRIYDSLEKRYGISDEISMQKIKIYQAVGKDANVREELQNLIREFPNETKYRAIRAQLNMRSKKYKEAYADYMEILSIDPSNAYIHLSLADYYTTMKDTAKVREEMVLAFQNPNLDIDAKVTLVLPYYAIPSRKAEAYAMLDAMLATHPKDPKALAVYADFLQRDDRYAEAREKYREINKIDSTKYLIWEALMLCNLNLLDTVALLNDAQEALELFPEQPFIYYVLGAAHNLKGDYLTAVQYLGQGAELAYANKPLQGQFYSYLGDIHHQLDNHAKSDENYRKALEIDPQNVLVLNNFSYFLSLRKEHLNEAERMSRLACQKEPNNPTYLDTFAWVLYQQGKYKEAKNIMELAMRHGGDKEAVLLEHYGDILWKFGDKARALELWKQAKNLDEKACSEFLNDKIQSQNIIEN